MDGIQEVLQAAGGSHVVAGTVALILALLAGIWMYQRSSDPWNDFLPDNILTGNNSKKNSKNTDTTTASKPNDPWEQRQSRGISSSSSTDSSAEKNSETTKPFHKSTYYYAHNDPKAKGGYKDGLRMEDYTMNQPRLLSRGGVPVTEDSKGSEDGGGSGNDEPITNDAFSKMTLPAVRPTKKYAEALESGKRSLHPEKPTLPILRYLWDDPGNDSGLAFIRIDSVPVKDSTEMIPWKDVNVTETSAELDGEGLQVVIKTAGEVDYSLKIGKLFGDVEEVSCKCTKRLVVRLQKKNCLVDKTTSNFAAWPQPHKKAVSFL